MEASRPNVKVEFNYFNGNKIGIIIKTGENKEIIDKLVISFVVEGIVTEAYPRGNIINSEPPTIKFSPFYSVSKDGNPPVPVLNKVTVECNNVRDSVLNGVVIEYRLNTLPVKFNEDIIVEWYWKFEGQGQKETKQISRNKPTAH